MLPVWSAELAEGRCPGAAVGNVRCSLALGTDLSDVSRCTEVWLSPGHPGPVNEALAQGVVLCLAENSVKGGLAVGTNLLIKDP